MKIALKILLIVTIFFLVACFAVTMLLGYEKTMLLILGDSPNVGKILTMVSATKFLILQVLCLVAAVVCLVLLLVLDRVITLFERIYEFLKKSIQALMNEFRFTEIKWLLILPVGSSVFFAVVMPVSYDEAYTYLQFTSKSIFVSLSFYPLPNNHVLHSVITNITRYIPFLPVLFCLRISSLVVSFFTWLLCYSFIKKYYSKHIALLITGIASMLFMSVYYSYMSRGYGLVAFFFVVSFYASYAIVFHCDDRKNWLVFAVSNVLGFFTMPSYLYVFIILNIFILWNSRQQFKNQLRYTIFTIVIVVILYVPIIVVNGVRALTSNRFVLPISRKEVINQLPEFLENTLTEIIGVNYLYVCLLLLVSCIILIKFKMKFELKTFAVFILLPFILLIAHSVIPFPRTFNYYAIVLVFLGCIPYWKVIQQVSITYLVSIIVVIQVALFFNFYSNIKTYESFNIPYHEINRKICGRDSYFLSSDFFPVNFLFENKVNKDSIRTLYNYPGKVDADTVQGYDYLVIDKKYDVTKNRKTLYSDGQTNVYGR